MKINFVKLGVNLALFGLKIQGRVPTRYRDNERKKELRKNTYTLDIENQRI